MASIVGVDLGLVLVLVERDIVQKRRVQAGSQGISQAGNDARVEKCRAKFQKQCQQFRYRKLSRGRDLPPTESSQRLA